MKKLLFALITLGTLGTFIGTNNGYSDYQNGYVEGGYIYNNGYWWYNNIPYTRQQEAYVYYSCGYPYYGYRYKYYQTNYSTPTVSNKSYDWKSQLLKIAEQRDEIEGKMRLAALDNQVFLQTVDALGLANNFTFQNYGQSVMYPNYQLKNGSYVNNNLQLGHYGAQGNSVYGYTFSTVADLYGQQLNVNSLYQQANKLALNAQSLSGQATKDFGNLVGQEGANRARVAEILAKGEAGSRVLTAAEGTSSRVVQSVTKVIPGEPVPVPVPVPVPAPDQPQPQQLTLQQSIQNRCVSCHSGTKPDGGLDITKYPTFTDEQKDIIFDRVNTKDLTKRMPRLKDGGPAPQLLREERMLYAR